MVMDGGNQYYNGMWKNDMPEGEGLMLYNQGEYYEGNWKEGQWHG